MTSAHPEKQLEQLWIKYQFDIAGLRGALGPLFNVAFHARQAHTFNAGEGPETRAVHATMGPTPGEPNGIPDGHAVMTGPTYGARAASVMAASTILMTFDSAIQELATRLGGGRGANMRAGDRIGDVAQKLFEPASTLIWAAVNNIRHVDEWHASAAPRSRTASDRLQFRVLEFHHLRSRKMKKEPGFLRAPSLPRASGMLGDKRLPSSNGGKNLSTIYVMW